MALRGGSSILTLVLTAAAFIFTGVIPGVLCLFVAACIGLVLWTPLGSWLGFSSDQQTSPLVRHTLDGGSTLRLAFDPDKPQTVLWEVGIENPNQFNLEGVALNVLIPRGLREYQCDHHGEKDSRGHWLTTPEVLHDEPAPGTPKDFWAEEGITLPGDGLKMFFFKLKITRPGTYYFCTELFGSVPKQREYAKLEVVAADQGDADRIGEFIAEGEKASRTRDSLIRGGEERQAFMAWYLHVLLNLDDEAASREFQSAFDPETEADEGGYFGKRFTTDVHALYEIRRHLRAQGSLVNSA